MTTAQFIAKTYNTTNDKWGTHGYDRWCSSVKTDKHGIVYSYGRHYPLAFHVKGLDFVNVAGYSVTTSKHIGWAKQALGYNNYIGVKLDREESEEISNEYITDDRKIKAIQRALQREYDDLNKQLKAKKRTDTQVYRHLYSEMIEVGASLVRVTA